MDFKTAYLRLEEIVKYIKTNQVIDIEELLRMQEESKELYEYLQTCLIDKHEGSAA